MWRKNRLRVSRPALFCILGMIFGMSGTLMLTSVRRVARIPFCDSGILNEVKEQQLLLVGVMTAAKYVDSRAYNVWKTWAQFIPGKVLFFVAEDTVSIHKDLPLIRLKGVTDVYPPQKKSFAMLKWMADNYLNDFKWFMRADDDLYVRGSQLENFLRSLDSDKPQLIGQAGLGNSEEYGQLSLGQQDNYCMGGPGIVMSRETLRTVAPHLRSCLMELLTTHEDVELGRCMRKHVGIACTWNYEMNKLFHNNQTVPHAYQGDLSEVYPAITLHPIKRPSVMRRIHLHNRALKLAELRSLRISLNNDKNGGKPPPLTRHIANDPSDLFHWDFIAANNILFCANQVNCPRHTVDSNIRMAINGIVTQIFDEFNSNARQRGRILQYQGLQYGYTRLEPRFGVDYILDMVLWFKKFRKPHRATVSVRRHAYIRQTFGPIEATTDSYIRETLRQRADKFIRVMKMNASDEVDWSRTVLPKENNHIYIILPLAGRSDTFKRFSNYLRNVCIEKNGFSLVIVLFATGTNEDAITADLIKDLMVDINVQVVDMGMVPFSRGLALAQGAGIMQPDALLFFTDVDMLFTCDMFDRIRLNTIRGAQVYFPIVFSEYSPKSWSKNERLLSDTFHYGRRHGYFRHFGFGLAAMYKSDLDLVGGLNVSIQGWGMEDVDLFEKCIKSPLRIFRAPEPALIHVYHKIHCSKSMPPTQYEMCIGSKAASLTSLDYLVDRITSQS